MKNPVRPSCHSALLPLLVGAVFILLPTTLALATTRTVNSNADNQSNGCTNSPGDCTLREAIEAGVEVLAYRASVTPTEIRLETKIPVVCP